MRVLTTDDAWARAVEQLPMRVSGAIATWIPLGETTVPWETPSLSNRMDGDPFGRADEALMLALLALEATFHALQHEGPSAIFVPDRNVASRLNNRRVR